MYIKERITHFFGGMGVGNQGDSSLNTGEKKGRVLTKGFLVLVILVSISITLAGCVEKNQEASEEEYWGYIKASGEHVKIARETWKEALKAMEEEDYLRALKLTREVKKQSEMAKESALLAAETTNNVQMKMWAECLAETANYGSLHDEKVIESLEYKIQGDEEKALNTIQEANDYSSKGLEQARKCQGMKPNKS